MEIPHPHPLFCPMKASDSLWFRFLVRASVSGLKCSGDRFWSSLPYCSSGSGNAVWTCTHAHFWKEAILNLSFSSSHAPPFSSAPFLHSPLSSPALHFCSRQWPVVMIKIHHRIPRTHRPISSSCLCSCTVPSHRGWIYVFSSSCGSRDCFVLKWEPIDLLLHH